MKGRYWLLIVAVVIGCFYWLGQSQQSAYEACVAAGVQSNDTCRFYSMQ